MSSNVNDKILQHLQLLKYTGRFGHGRNKYVLFSTYIANNNIAKFQKPQEIPSERELSRNSPNAQNAVHLGIPKDFDMFCFQAETQASSTKALLIKLQNGAETHPFGRLL